jgi:hypothetical protein
VTTLAGDEGLAMNVRNSARRAYEAEAMDRLKAICVNGMLTSEGERELFFAELSRDGDFLKQLALEVVRRIQLGPHAV